MSKRRGPIEYVADEYRRVPAYVLMWVVLVLLFGALLWVFLWPWETL